MGNGKFWGNKLVGNGKFYYLCRVNKGFMEERLFKRKIYTQLLNWKQESDGKSALLVEGARRVGKSTIVETFAKNESGT